MGHHPPAATPSIEVIARGLLFRGGAILLCQNTKHGYFYLPGGHVDPSETAINACIREFIEETGLAVRAIDPDAARPDLIAEVLFQQSGRPRHEYTLVFHVEHVPTDAYPELPEQVASVEPGLAFAWADPAALVDLDLRPAAIKSWLVAGGEASMSTAWVSVREA